MSPFSDLGKQHSTTDSYAWEKFYLAILGMASSPQSLQDRLGDAYNFHLMHVWKANIPDPDLWGRIEAVLKVLKGCGTERTHIVTDRLSDTEAHLTREIVSIYDAIARSRRL